MWRSPESVVNGSQIQSISEEPAMVQIIETFDVDGADRELEAEITEQHPDERVAWVSTGGETHHAGAVTFHKLTDSSTRVESRGRETGAWRGDVDA
ncbi:hypothetical protein ACTU6U_07595 [Microbacterium sp. A196]|uniref:hypothetical protein n=1 Tax=Microbacterium sp. A196 TaxID=3457320 RepID=UPI003FD51090